MILPNCTYFLLCLEGSEAAAGEDPDLNTLERR
jgi:hypothetical protein